MFKILITTLLAHCYYGMHNSPPKSLEMIPKLQLREMHNAQLRDTASSQDQELPAPPSKSRDSDDTDDTEVSCVVADHDQPIIETAHRSFGTRIQSAISGSIPQVSIQRQSIRSEESTQSHHTPPRQRSPSNVSDMSLVSEKSLFNLSNSDAASSCAGSPEPKVILPLPGARLGGVASSTALAQIQSEEDSSDNSPCMAASATRFSSMQWSDSDYHDLLAYISQSCNANEISKLNSQNMLLQGNLYFYICSKSIYESTDTLQQCLKKHCAPTKINFIIANIDQVLEDEGVIYDILDIISEQSHIPVKCIGYITRYFRTQAIYTFNEQYSIGRLFLLLTIGAICDKSLSDANSVDELFIKMQMKTMKPQDMNMLYQFVHKYSSINIYQYIQNSDTSKHREENREKYNQFSSYAKARRINIQRQMQKKSQQFLRRSQTADSMTPKSQYTVSTAAPSSPMMTITAVSTPTERI